MENMADVFQGCLDLSSVLGITQQQQQNIKNIKKNMKIGVYCSCACKRTVKNPVITDTEWAIESIRIRGLKVDVRENVRVFFSQGQSKLVHNNEVSVTPGFDCTCKTKLVLRLLNI